MFKEDIKVNFYYGDEVFEKLIANIISQKLSYYFREENINKMCYSKDNRTTTICQEKNTR